MTTNVLKKGWFNPISISVLLILIAISICLYLLQIVNVALFVLLLIIAVLLASSIRIADQWERAVVLRMGKFCGLKGPGPFMIVPILDSVSTYIDQRVRVSAFKAEQTLTKDTGPGQCGCRCLLDGLGRGEGGIGSSGISNSHRTHRTNRIARYHR